MNIQHTDALIKKKIGRGVFKVLTAPSDQKVVSSNSGLVLTHYQALKKDPTLSILRQYDQKFS